MKSVHIEYLALETSASLVDVCALARSALGLPGLSFDSEDATEWGSCWLEGIEYNVSRPHEPGTLHEWDGSVPDGCDVAMFLGLDASHPRVADPTWAAEVLAPSVAQRMADAVSCRVFHHRTWPADAGRTARSVRVFVPSGRER